MADTNKAGNKKVILKPWEEELLNFIEGDTDNPAIVRLKGAVTAGTEETQNGNSVSFDTSVCCICTHCLHKILERLSQTLVLQL
ncbi:hypothetical protein J6590_091044 [Homalodisca vitripennis]|nr:hypothetical protein J6590_091044 [Homalodisca vitripennis]